MGKLDYLKRISAIILGSFIYAVAVNEYIIPHHLLSGGVSGVAIMIQYGTGISAGVLILLMNIPIFIIGIKEIDRDFIIHSFVGMVSSSVFLIILKYVSIFQFLRVDDTMLSSIFGGVITGIGSGIIFRSRGSVGGTDIIAVIVKKKRSINIGSVIFAINLLIICISSALYGMKPALFTLISMYISADVLDRVQEGFDRRKSIFIISDKVDQISEGILKKLHRGVTLLHGEGAYTMHDKRIIYCIVTTKQLAELKLIIETIDPKAFLTISDTAEVLGKGFKRKAL